MATKIAAKLQWLWSECFKCFVVVLLAASRFSGFVYEKLVGKVVEKQGRRMVLAETKAWHSFSHSQTEEGVAWLGRGLIAKVRWQWRWSSTLGAH